MILAVSTNLERIVKLALVKRIVTLRAFYKDALGAHRTLFVVFGRIYLGFVAFEPGHL